MISTILVPTDGSKAAKKAGAVAIDLTKQLNATMIILSVVDADTDTDLSWGDCSA